MEPNLPANNQQPKKPVKKRTLILVLLPVITLLTLARLFAHDGETPAAKLSASGSNIWNAA
jgi:hypothetical protein